MNIVRFKDYEAMSEASAQLISDIVLTSNDVNICLASGGSPMRTYELFVQKLQGKNVDNLIITKLDEWCGVEKDSELSCERYLRERVVNPLKISDHNFISFLPNVSDSIKECQKIQEALTKKPIDLCVLGLGKNGHLGLNEPEATLHPFAHVATLSAITKGHAMLQGKPINQGMTIGMKEILQSKRILLQISGEGKEEILKGFLNQQINPLLPASFLWLHNHVDVYIREDQYPE